MSIRNKILFPLLLCICMGSSCFAEISMVWPPNNFISPSFKVTFSWNAQLNFTSYRLRIAHDPGFTVILKDIVVNATSADVTFSNSSDSVYWQVSVVSTHSYYLVSPVYKLNFINPSQNPNLLLWLSADSNVSILPDSTIDSWNNIIPNGLNAVQVTPASRPKLVSNIPDLNNHRAVRFDGVDDFLQINSGGNVGNTYMMINWRGGGISFPNYEGILTRQNASINANVFFTVGAGTPLVRNGIGGYYDNNVYMNNAPSFNFFPLNLYRVLSGRRASSSIDNVPNFTIGRDPDGGASRSWNGDIPELIISKAGSSQSESDSMHAYLFNKYAPPVSLGKDIITGTSFSDTLRLFAENRFLSYLWSTGAITNSTVVLTGGTYTIKTKDIFGFDTQDDIEVYPYRRLKNNTVAFCEGDSLVIDLGITSPFTFSWSTGSTSNKITVKTSGRYTVRIRDRKGQEIIDTLNVVVDLPQLSILPDVSGILHVCKNEKLFLNTATFIDSIHWSTGSTSNFIILTTPGTYTVYARTAPGCVISKTFNVVISGEAPIADFILPKGCQSSPTLFIDSSIAQGTGSVITNWKWTFGDDSTQFITNPAHAYTNLGNYHVGLKITTNQGCSDSISKTITVNKKPVPLFSNTIACAGNPTIFIDGSIANSTAVTHWTWDFSGLGTITDIQNPSFRFPSAGTYNVRLTATNSNSCFDTATHQIAVSPSPIADFLADSVCGRTPVSFKFTASAVPPSTLTTHTWDFGDGTQESVIVNAQHQYLNPGEYIVQLVVRSSDQCIDTVSKAIRVFDFPVVDFITSQTQCTGKEIQFTDISYTPDSTAITKWHWFFSGQATDTIQNPKYIFNTEGNYTIQLTASNAVGCTGTKLRSIAVSAPPSPKFTFSPQNGLPPLNVSYFNQSSANGNYIWDYGDGSSPVVGYNPPQHTYTVKGTYPIKLTATDFKGCTDSLVQYILVDKAYLDGVLATISITPDGAFYQVRITILNNSNIEIRSLGLSLQLNGGSTIRENWTGSLLPGRSVDYIFTGEIKLGTNSVPVICATIDNINDNSPEDRTDNNSSCKELSVGRFDVLTVYPNPAFDNINFGIMLPQAGRVHIDLINYLGQEMYSVDYDGVKGYNNLPMPTMELNSAVYIAEITFSGETIRKKFMRKDLKK
ncbi:MAG: hypothetical protein JWN78_2678 [Bacteroidota bacterium]|nr:hypothetical protein [Bacteroidota bacterium]